MINTCSRVGNDLHVTMTASICSVDDEGSLEIAGRLVVAGRPIVIPTETIYGLTCDAGNPAAVAAVYAIKGRSLEKLSAIFLASRAAIAGHALIESDGALRVISKFLPGPLTVVLRSRRRQWPGVVGTEGKIGIRVSSDSFVCRLAKHAGMPLLATSANRSGSFDCRTLDEVKEQLGEAVELLLYRQAASRQQPSTVVDLSGERPVLLREGAIDFADIERTFGSRDRK